MLRAESVEGNRRTSKRGLEGTHSETAEKEGTVESWGLAMEISQAEGSDKLCEMLLAVK